MHGRSSVNQKVVPIFSMLSTPIWPPINSTNRLQIASPSPVPPKRPWIDASAWAKRPNNDFTFSGAMPMPVSRISTRKLCTESGPAAARTATVTAPLSVNLTALPMRLTRIWLIRVGSPNSAGATWSSTTVLIVIPLSLADSEKRAVTCSRSWENENGRG